MRGPFRPRPLRHARLQAVLAIAAMAAAVSLPVVLVSVGGGVEDHELTAIENSGYQIVVSAGGEHGIEHSHALAATIDRVTGVAEASPVLSIAIDAFPSGGSASPVLAEGVIPDAFSATLGPTESDLFPNPLPLGDPSDTVHFANGSYAGPATDDVLVSSPYAASAHLTVGATLDLGPTASQSQASPYTITGIFGVPKTILGPVGAFALVLPLSDLQVMCGYASGNGTVVPDASDTIQVAVSGAISVDPAKLSAVESAIQSQVPYYQVTSLTQEAAQLEAADSVLTGFYLALSSVGLVVGLLFLALVLLRRIEADRRSIGIRRALGLSRGSIAMSVVVDGLVLAAAGAVAGLLGGYAVVAALAADATGTVQEAASLAVFDPRLLGGIVAAVLVLSIVASLVAARSALRIEVAEALR